MGPSFLASEASDTAPEDVRGAEPRARLAQIDARLAQLRAAFAQNLVAATSDWWLQVPEQAGLEGMTERDKSRARRHAEAQQLEGYLLTLDTPSYEAALHHLDDRKLRHDVYEAFVTRASDQGPRKRRFDNGPLVQETLALRHELAVLHGYENYAEYALRDGPLTSCHEVERFLLTGGEQIRARAQAELDEIWTFAKAKGAPKGFATWDLGYYASWLLRERLDFRADELRAYFAFPDVLSGAFALCERLLGLGMVPLAGGDSGREAVLYRVITEAGDELGWLEIEPQHLPGRAGGPRIMASEEHADSGDEPVLRLGLELEAVGAREAVLLRHEDVSTLFRRLGEGLCLLLSHVRARRSPPREPTLAAALVSRYFEQLSAHIEVVATFARHHASGAALPRALFAALTRSRAMYEGLTAARELEDALFDLRVHRDFVPPDRATQLRQHVFDTLAQVRREVCVLRPPFWDKSVHANRALFVDDGALRVWESVWAKRAARQLFVACEADPLGEQAASRLRGMFWADPEQGVLERLTDALGQRPVLLP